MDGWMNQCCGRIAGFGSMLECVRGRVDAQRTQRAYGWQHMRAHFVQKRTFLKKIIAPRGPLSDLCVVVVTMSAYSKGLAVTWRQLVVTGSAI